MEQQNGNHETTGPEVEEELDPFEQLAAALQTWTPDVSGDKETLRLRKWDLNLQTWQPLDLLVDWLKYRKGYEFANGFEGEFQQLYKEVREFYDKVVQGEFTEEQLFNEQIPFLKAAVERLALYVVRVQAMCQNDAGIESPGLDADDEDRPVPACIDFKHVTITIGSASYTPTADSIWTFLRELVDNYDKGEPTDKEEWKGQWTMLGREPKKGIGPQGRKRLVRITKDGYWRCPDVKVKLR